MDFTNNFRIYFSYNDDFVTSEVLRDKIKLFPCPVVRNNILKLQTSTTEGK